MNPHTLALSLTIAAGWLSFNTLIIVGYFYFCKKEALGLAASSSGAGLTLDQTSPSKLGGASPTVADESSAENALPEAKPEVALDGAALATSDLTPIASYCLFVVFNQPDIALNQKIQALMNTWEASYDASLQVYLIAGVTPQNPVRVANAYPPGVMPSAEAFLDEASVLSGVSLIVEKLKRKRGFDKVQLGKLITLGEEFAALGGDILDAERKPASSKTFKNITG
ncbi:hypothetical protein B0H98_106172 [Vreelandella songnenensis]|uniref:Cell division protein ZipA n=1 Tax=Vreelandella songnenensis TaxID=1176243 RepID=A0A2T0V263_9GAMM|nr:hypothetical protein [Halomonas songnenensis]PRY64260.1 hypothetical protein B0H98_106172 [Halomonas songnenensis]